MLAEERGGHRARFGQRKQALRRRPGWGEFRHAVLSEDADLTRRKAFLSLDLLRKVCKERKSSSKERQYCEIVLLLLYIEYPMFSDNITDCRF